MNRQIDLTKEKTNEQKSKVKHNLLPAEQYFIIKLNFQTKKYFKDEQKDKYKYKYRQIDRQEYSQIDRQIDRWIDGQMDKQIDRQIDRQIDEQIASKTHVIDKNRQSTRCHDNL